MTSEIDHILDRRSLRKKVTFWRVLSLIGLAVVLVAILGWAGAFSGLSKPGNHIARVAISGTITEDRDLLKLLKTLEDDQTVKGVVLSINSPGGTAVGGEAIYSAVRELAEQKPVATNVGTLATSAGYMIAAASDHIVARNASIIGSIGVIVQYPEASQLLDKIGVAMNEVKSSPLKAEPSPFKPAPPEAVEMLQSMINDTYNWFVDMVAERRSLTRAEVLVIADGRVFSGHRAKETKLIDSLGGEETARKWLVEQKGLDDNLKLIDTPIPRPSRGGLLSSSYDRLLNLDEGNLLKMLQENGFDKVIPRRLFLDGVLSIWHG